MIHQKWALWITLFGYVLMSFFSIAFTIPYLSDMWEKAVYVLISSYALTLFGSFFSIAFFLVSVANFFGWVKKSVLEDFPFWILLRTLGFDFFIDKPKWLVVMLLHVPCFNLLLRSHQRNVIVSTHFRLVRIQSCNLDDQFTARLVFTQYFDTLHIFRLINKISNQRIRRKIWIWNAICKDWKKPIKWGKMYM